MSGRAARAPSWLFALTAITACSNDGRAAQRDSGVDAAIAHDAGADAGADASFDAALDAFSAVDAALPEPVITCPTPVTLGISPADPASLARGIRLAADAGCTGVVIPPGTYALPVSSDRFTLLLVGLSNFYIDARGVTLLFTDPAKGGIAFRRCTGVTLRGATLRHDPLPFTQGEIEAISPDGHAYDVRIAAGYPSDLTNAAHFSRTPLGYVFDPATHQWKAGTIDLAATSVDDLGGGLFRFHWAGTSPAVTVHDFIAFRGLGLQDIYIGSDADHIRILGVTILGGGGFCVHETRGEGYNTYTYRVTYAPRPVGATMDPLVASNFDAFHSSSVRHGPHLEGCMFEGMGDDGIPIHGSYSLVMSVSGARVTMSDDAAFRVGDPIRFFGTDGGLADEGTVVRVVDLPSFVPSGTSQYSAFADLSVRHFQELTLDHAVAASFDWLASNPAANGSGYVIRNNVIRNNRARGILLKADDGLVEGNLIDGSTIAGIVLAPETYWDEACYSRNVIIRNNIIRHVGYAMVGPWVDQSGAITITGTRASVPGHRHIVIEGNTIEDVDGNNLLITSARDVAVTGNHFVRPEWSATTRGATFTDPHALVWLDACDDIRFSGNTVSERGAEGSELVHATARASAVSGATSGVSLVP